MTAQDALAAALAEEYEYAPIINPSTRIAADAILAALAADGWEVRRVGELGVRPRCIFNGCVATWEHWHGGFPGGYGNPEDPQGPPILLTGPDPVPGAVRDYNGALLTVRLAAKEATDG